MPLVLAMNDASESGISYDDVPYESYEYPLLYRSLIQPGERFVYYRGRKRVSGGRQPQVYLGTGIVGAVEPSSRADRLVCVVLDGRPFADPVAFRSEDGTPLESGGVRRGYYQRGVRSVSEVDFASIVARGFGRLPVARPLGASWSYARPEVARAIEDYSRRAAEEWLVDRFRCEVTQMPLNNPGFDLRTSDPALEFVEVKGTQAHVPRFLISEAERVFASTVATRYALVVVTGIDLASQTHVGVELRRGAIEDYSSLAATQWSGCLT